MKMSDIFDIPIVYRDNNGHFFELKFDGYTLDGFTDFPIQAFVTKGKRIYKKDIGRYYG